MACQFKRRSLLLLSLMGLTMLVAASAYVLPAEEKPINYKLVRNLKQLTDRSPAPTFTLPDFAGGKVRLEDFRGKLLMINFWASWCVPCREEMPAMERLYRKYRDNGFVLLGVNLQDDKIRAAAFIKELQITFPTAFDPDGEVGRLYGAWGLPATYLIDDKGIALARAWGPADWFSADARKLIEALLARQERSKRIQ